MDPASTVTGIRNHHREDRTPMAAGTKEDPWVLTTPPGSSEYTMYRDEEADPPALVCQVGTTSLAYRLRAVEDLHAWLAGPGRLGAPRGGGREEGRPPPGTVEAWGRSPDNPVGGWYGLRKGYRGRFGMYLPPLLELLGLAELTHDARNNRMRAWVGRTGAPARDGHRETEVHHARQQSSSATPPIPTGPTRTSG